MIAFAAPAFRGVLDALVAGVDHVVVDQVKHTVGPLVVDRVLILHNDLQELIADRAGVLDAVLHERRDRARLLGVGVDVDGAAVGGVMDNGIVLFRLVDLRQRNDRVDRLHLLEGVALKGAEQLRSAEEQRVFGELDLVVRDAGLVDRRALLAGVVGNKGTGPLDDALHGVKDLAERGGILVDVDPIPSRRRVHFRRGQFHARREEDQRGGKARIPVGHETERVANRVGAVSVGVDPNRFAEFAEDFPSPFALVDEVEEVGRKFLVFAESLALFEDHRGEFVGVGVHHINVERQNAHRAKNVDEVVAAENVGAVAGEGVAHHPVLHPALRVKVEEAAGDGQNVLENAVGFQRDVQVEHHIDEQIRRVGGVPLHDGIDLRGLFIPTEVPVSVLDVDAEGIHRGVVTLVDHLRDRGGHALFGLVGTGDVNVVLRDPFGVGVAVKFKLERAVRGGVTRDLRSDRAPVLRGDLRLRALGLRCGLRRSVAALLPFLSAGREREREENDTQEQGKNAYVVLHVFLLTFNDVPTKRNALPPRSTVGTGFLSAISFIVVHIVAYFTPKVKGFCAYFSEWRFKKSTYQQSDGR